MVDQTEAKNALRDAMGNLQAAQLEFDSVVNMFDAAGMRHSQELLIKRRPDCRKALDELLDAKVLYYRAAKAYSLVASDDDTAQGINYTRQQ